MAHPKKGIDRADQELDSALARSQLYRWLGMGLRYPSDEVQRQMREERPSKQLQESCRWIDKAQESRTAVLAGDWIRSLRRLDAEELKAAHIQAFGHTPQAQVPLYETEYGDAQSLKGLHELANIAGFYQAFGLAVAAGAGERVDHAAVECDFLHFLCYKEAYAVTHHGQEQRDLCAQAQIRFLQEHFSRWIPSLARRILECRPAAVYTQLARLLQEFLRTETRRFGLPETSEQLGIRTPTPSMETDCMTCSVETACPGGADGVAVRSASD